LVLVQVGIIGITTCIRTVFAVLYNGKYKKKGKKERKKRAKPRLCRYERSILGFFESGDVVLHVQLDG
jgi:hypothetical protein